MRHTLTALFSILTITLVSAQEMYFAAIRTEGGRGVITGLLFRVNDSTVEILPGRVRRDMSLVHMKETLHIPIRVIRDVSLRRVRPSGMVILESLLISTAAAVISVAAVPNNPRMWLPMYFGTSITMLSAYAAIIIKTYKPKDHFFREELEERSIVKDERSIASN
ncbi:MAG TPA: hypothetical protein VFE50_04735 [Cyclobacteriaceae bacterium]|nr:hypothetical protein [Cyclobacteriaceae bacterium]